MTESHSTLTLEADRPATADVTRLRDLSPAQWKSGIAAWLGWMFDGLDMHLYTLVALPFVAELLQVPQTHARVGPTSSWIQAAFLVGWALGGGFFGRIGDRLGRTRALMLTILTYALFTGLSFFAQTWWHLFIFRFLAALGIGGEWAVGASLLSETWPRRWRPWLAAVLQSGVNIGVLLACLAFNVLLYFSFANRSVFLVGVLPALLVFWIRRAVPESPEWHAARCGTGVSPVRHIEPAADPSGLIQLDYASQTVLPGIVDLFRGSVRRTTILTLLVCAFSLTAHWAFMFWCFQHLRNLPSVKAFSEAQVSVLVSHALLLLMVMSIVGNFLAAIVARWTGYRRAIVALCVGYFGCMAAAYSVPRGHEQLWWFLAVIGVCQGVFALFTMYLPPLFPTLLRTTGAGFCYNIGRIAAAFGTIFFGLFTQVGDYRVALFAASFLFLPAAAIACFLPESSDTATVMLLDE